MLYECGSGMAEPVDIAVSGGRHVFDFGKCPREMEAVAEAGGGGNLLDGRFGVGEHQAGAFNALEVDMGVRSAAHLHFEQAGEGAGTHAGLPCQGGIAYVSSQAERKLCQSIERPYMRF